MKLENDRVIGPREHLEVRAFTPGKEVFLYSKYKLKSYCKPLGKVVGDGTLDTFKYNHIELLILSFIFRKAYFVKNLRN